MLGAATGRCLSHMVLGVEETWSAVGRQARQEAQLPTPVPACFFQVEVADESSKSSHEEPAQYVVTREGTTAGIVDIRGADRKGR